jgi:hypothetical protein
LILTLLEFSATGLSILSQNQEKQWVKGLPIHRLEPGTHCKVCQPAESKNTIVTITLKDPQVKKILNKFNTWAGIFLFGNYFIYLFDPQTPLPRPNFRVMEPVK